MPGIFLTTFLIGSILGFATAIPVAGPISALVLSYGIKERYAQARMVALGAAIVESIYAFIAFMVFGELLTRFKSLFVFSNFVVIGVLIALGVYFFRSKRLRNPGALGKTGGARKTKAFFAGAAVSLANPSVIATWGAAIGLLHSMMTLELSTASYILFSLGICLGIFTWFVLFLKIIKRHRNRFDVTTTDKILKGFACFLFVLAAWMSYGTISVM